MFGDLTGNRGRRRGSRLPALTGAGRTEADVIVTVTVSTNIPTTRGTGYPVLVGYPGYPGYG